MGRIVFKKATVREDGCFFRWSARWLPEEQHNKKGAIIILLLQNLEVSKIICIFATSKHRFVLNIRVESRVG